MAKMGNCDFSGFKKFAKQFEKLTQNQMDEFYTSCCKALAARLLAFVIPRTPVGQYPAASGKQGGTLRRGWTSKTTGGSGADAAAYAQSLQVKKIGSAYQVEIVNPVEYASYVEYGHRTANKTGWVEGKFMLTLSEQELQKIAPKVLEKKLEAYLKECFGGDS